jgi:hypothetical protein
LFHLAFEGISEAELLTLNDILSRLHSNLEQLPR